MQQQNSSREKLFNHCHKIQNALNVWFTKRITVEEEMLIFKTGISKIDYLSLIMTVPNSIEEEIQKIRRAFL